MSEEEIKWIVGGFVFLMMVICMAVVINGEYRAILREKEMKEKELKGIKTNTVLGGYTSIMRNYYYKEDMIKQNIRECNKLVRRTNEIFSENEENIDKDWVRRMNLKREKALIILEKYKDYDEERKELLKKETLDILKHIQKELSERLERMKQTVYEEDVKKMKEKRKEIEEI